MFEGEEAHRRVSGIVEEEAEDGRQRGFQTMTPPSIPTRKECLRLMERYRMLPNIREHSLQVARVALFLAEELKSLYPQLDLALIEAGALLHDIAKTETLVHQGNHARLGEDMVRDLGFERLAPLVGQHVRLQEGYFPDGRIDEVVLVHYADKRVRHDEIVGLRERFDYLLETYGRTPEAVERIEALYQETLMVEGWIFQNLPFSPQELSAQMQRLPERPAVQTTGHDRE